MGGEAVSEILKQVFYFPALFLLRVDFAVKGLRMGTPPNKTVENTEGKSKWESWKRGQNRAERVKKGSVGVLKAQSEGNRRRTGSR